MKIQFGLAGIIILVTIPFTNAVASEDTKTDVECEELSSEAQSECRLEDRIDEIFGISLPKTKKNDDGIVGAGSVVSPVPTSVCQFSNERTGIFHLAADVYDEMSSNEVQEDTGGRDRWYLLIWVGDPEQSELAVHSLIPDRLGKSFHAANELIDREGQRTFAYALVWKDQMVNIDTGVHTEILRVNAGYEDGQAYEVFMSADRRKYEYAELGCGINLIEMGNK